MAEVETVIGYVEIGLMRRRRTRGRADSSRLIAEIRCFPRTQHAEYVALHSNGEIESVERLTIGQLLEVLTTIRSEMRAHEEQSDG
jgi:hypothetical protein